jgi:uncharacterized membrane protein
MADVTVHERLREEVFGPVPPKAAAAPPATTGASWSVPALAGLLAVLVVTWSINRCIDYSEVFQASRRARCGILVANVAAVLVLVLLSVCWCRRM